MRLDRSEAISPAIAALLIPRFDTSLFLINPPVLLESRTFMIDVSSRTTQQYFFDWVSVSAVGSSSIVLCMSSISSHLPHQLHHCQPERHTMLRIKCSGTPYEIGFTHGQYASAQIHRTISFYTTLFMDMASLPWSRVLEIASTFSAPIATKWPAYHSEMRGIAAGAGVTLLDIIAINVRTEISFGLFSDGCTALSWRTGDVSFLAQNWDWMDAQRENLVFLEIEQRPRPCVKMVTEAGLIGKIGMNDRGVGICLNAIRAKGVDQNKIPCHLGLRLVLDSASKDEAVRRLEEYGLASSCHMLVADGTGSVGLEWTFSAGRKLKMNESGQVFHSNHYLHKDLVPFDTDWMIDSGFRLDRIEQLCQGVEKPDMEVVRKMFRDEENFPSGICRKTTEAITNASTLFSIVMELRSKRAIITLGRPVAPEQEFEISFWH